MGRPKGYIMSDDAKKRISEANKGRQTTLGIKFGDETKKKHSISAKGRTFITNGVSFKYVKGEEYEEYIKNGWIKGKPILSEESRIKMSNSQKKISDIRSLWAKDNDTWKNVEEYQKFGYIIVLNGKLYDSISSAARDNGFKSLRALKYLIDNNQDLLYRKYGIVINYISDGIVKKNREEQEADIITNINKSSLKK